MADPTIDGQANIDCNQQNPKKLETGPEKGGVSLSTLTSDLCAIANKAFSQESAASLAVARAALVDIARLNGVAGGEAPAASGARVIVLADRPLSEEEWTSLHLAAD